MKGIAFLLTIAMPLSGQTIAPHAIAAHMRFLASDLLEGRETGTRGFDIAAPPNFPSDQRAFYSGSRLKEKPAAQHGAIGVLTLNTITDEKRSPFEKRAQQTGIPPMLYLDGGRPADAIEGIRLTVLLSRT